MLSRTFSSVNILRMSATLDRNGDGRPDLARPCQERSVLAVVTIQGNDFIELSHFPHSPEIVTPIRDKGGIRASGTAGGTPWNPSPD